MPSVSGWACDSWAPAASSPAWACCFYALGFRLGFATQASKGFPIPFGSEITFLCSRYRAGLCDSTSSPLSTLACGFYVLGIGLGFATTGSWPSTSCSRPRCFYALGIGLGFATDGSCVLAVHGDPTGGFYALGIGLSFATDGPNGQGVLPRAVSMPSVSGWALQHRTLRLERVVPGSFYALGFGLGFATGP